MKHYQKYDRPETAVEDIVKRELSEFKKTVSEDNFTINTERQFFSVLNYPFAKAGDVIEALHLFEKQAAEYLQENRPGEFALLSDHCLHVYVANMAPPFGAYVVGKKEERLHK